MEAEIDALFGVEDGGTAAEGGGGQNALAKLEMEGDDPCILYLHSDYNSQGLSLEASDGSITWAGSLSSQELATMAAKAKMETEEFISTTLKALTRKDLSSLDFTYTADTLGSGKLELSWKKHLVSLNIKFLLGTVTLSPDYSSPSDHTDLLEYAIAGITELQSANSGLQTNCNRLVAERERALERLEKCADLKEEIEGDLYGKFKVVLNNKKTKIRQLAEQNAKLMKQLEEMKNKPTHSRKASTPPATLHNPNESDTDNEMDATSDHSTTPPPRSKLTATASDPPAPPAATSCGLTTSILGDPLQKISPPTKRRRRGATSKKKASGQHPEIPLPPVFSSRSRSTSSSSSRHDDIKASSHDSLESNELLELL